MFLRSQGSAIILWNICCLHQLQPCLRASTRPIRNRVHNLFGHRESVWMYFLEKLQVKMRTGKERHCFCSCGINEVHTIHSHQHCVTILDWLFNFSIYMSYEVSPTWLTPVYLLFVQVAVTWLHLSLSYWTTSPLIDDSLLVHCCDSVLGVLLFVVPIVLPRYISQACLVASSPRLDFFHCNTVLQ